MTDFARQTEQQRVLIVGLGVSGVSSLHYLARGNARLTVTDSRSVPTGIDALRAQYPDVEFRLGGFATTAPLSQYDLAVVSPGVSLEDPFVSELIAAGVEIIGDIELFARAIAQQQSRITSHASPRVLEIGRAPV